MAVYTGRKQFEKKVTQSVFLILFIAMTVVLTGCNMSEAGELENGGRVEESYQEPGTEIDAADLNVENDNDEDDLFEPFVPRERSPSAMPFTEEDMYFDLLRADHSKDDMMAKMDEYGLVMDTHESAFETYFYNDSIHYQYNYGYTFDELPMVVTVTGPISCEGPRGIAVGDTFEAVLAKFPMEKDWTKEGVIYGGAYRDNEPGPPEDLTAEVWRNNETHTGGMNFYFGLDGIFSIEFENDLVTGYTCVLVPIWC